MKRLFFFLFFLMPFCSWSEYAERVFIDSSKNKVFLPSVPRRVVVTSPEVQEILFALGAGESIKANIVQCDYPAQARSLAKVGDFRNPDLEKIIKAQPDLIILTDLTQASLVSALNKLNYKFLVAFIKDLSELKYYFRLFGRIFRKEKEAGEWIRQMEGLKLNKTGEKRTILPLLWDNPMMVAGDRTIVNEVIEQAGGKNLLKNAGQGYFTLDEEFIIKNKPDYILVLDRDLDIRDRLKVVFRKHKNVRIIRNIDPDLILRAGPRVLDGIKELNSILSRGKKKQ
ncbi:MAG: helical backbone metal receptor [bacterium]|nr:helical backbone metal receptor [bacterium]